MINEVNGVKNLIPSRAAMKTVYWIVGVLAGLWITITVLKLVFVGEIKLTTFFIHLIVYGLTAGVLIPGFFGKSHLSVSERDIVCVKGVLTDRKVYLPMDAVRSVTMVVTPFGEYTGMNIIVFNAMGSRLIVWFLDKEDCIDLYGYVNELIMKRNAEI